MSLYILDTDVFSLFQRDHPVVVGRVTATPPKELAVTILTVEEQVLGRFAFIRKAKRLDQIALGYQLLTDTVKRLSAIQILSYTEPTIHRFSVLLALKLKVAKMDLRIAAVALEHGAVVVTRNLRDFGRVPGLTVEDWTV